MLEKIITIKNVGIFRNGTQAAITLKKLALIYADNARGKSTLSALLSACSTFDTQAVAQRQTIGVTNEQDVNLRFSSAATPPGFNVTFNGRTWNGNRPNLHVFNQAFVDRNVYTSEGVRPAQRQAFLELALGDAAVGEKSQFDQQAELQTECAKTASAAENALQGYRGQYTTDQFIALPQLANVDALIDEIDKQITEAKKIEQIGMRDEFKRLVVPSFNFDAILGVLQTSFESLSVEAEKTAKAHFAKHKGADTERWVESGMSHQPENECPFCGQPTGNLGLLKAYKAYFDDSYSKHQQHIAKLRDEVMAKLNESQLMLWTGHHQFNQGLLNVWAESLGNIEIPHFDYDESLEILANVKAELLSFIEQKERNPLVALDVLLFVEAQNPLQRVIAQAQDYNAQVTELNRQVASYKASLSRPNEQALAAQRAELVVSKNRHEARVIALVEELRTAREAHAEAGRAKKSARERLDRLMVATLGQFQTTINDWLSRFGAEFQIDQLGGTYQGGDVRSQYVLKVRGTHVNIGLGNEGPLSFHAALSEGDKRTLAFAFFLSQLFAASNRQDAVVVLDDVFTSLDKHRRHNTIEAVSCMARECAQVIVLGHDAYFLREVKKQTTHRRVCSATEIIELALHRDQDDYSYLGVFDLDHYCSSNYYKHYALVERFTEGESSATANPLEVAKALRPLLEGHLHRCFPKRFREGRTVGEMLGDVQNATGTNPLVRLKPHHAELVSFNDFAATFHHDTSGAYPRTEVNAAELLPFAKGILGFIQVRRFQ